MQKRNALGFILCATLFICCGCSSEINKSSTTSKINTVDKTETILVNKEKNTIKERYDVPKGYERISVEENNFGEFLRNSKLEKYGEKVKYYNGKTKNKENVYDSVFDVDIGDRDLHQCADAVMLLRAEYLYQNERYDEISFEFVNGFKAEYSKWRMGYRINVGENSCSYYKGAQPDNSYSTFRNYMDLVFAYSSTLSLEKELKSVDINDMQI